jgi:hypothetical protein
MSDEELYRCRVCGLWQDEPPWDLDGKCPTYTFCPCCGVEFGYGDCTLAAARTWREKWLAGGAKWDNPKMKPDDWNPDIQLEQLPTAYK